VDLKQIRDHLSAARRALGLDHSLSARLETVERRLTPGDSLWRDDAVSAERDLLAISTDMGQLPTAPPVNKAIDHVTAAIELL
jgi:hypothetical protein